MSTETIRLITLLDEWMVITFKIMQAEQKGIDTKDLYELQDKIQTYLTEEWMEQNKELMQSLLYPQPTN